MYTVNMKPSRLRVFTTLLFIVAFSVGFWQRQNAQDWWKLRSYEPPVNVARLATTSSMTEKARRIFYVQHPEIQEKDAFYKSCEEGETTVVLGCYKSNGSIFLLKVNDSRLAGVQEVTAAHEMLHAAYQRLSAREKQRVDSLLNQAYAGVTNSSITDKIDLYKKSGADITNELHSILGTEVETLPAQLEQYYAQYFDNRSTLTNFSKLYTELFASRKQKVADLDTRLAAIEAQVTANNQELNKKKAAIDAESARLDGLLRANKIDEYNQGVVAYNQSLAPFRSQLAETNSLIAQYKSILDERNSIAVEAQELSRALDSRIKTTVTE